MDARLASVLLKQVRATNECGLSPSQLEEALAWDEHRSDRKNRVHPTENVGQYQPQPSYKTPPAQRQPSTK